MCSVVDAVTRTHSAEVTPINLTLILLSIVCFKLSVLYSLLLLLLVVVLLCAALFPPPPPGYKPLWLSCSATEVSSVHTQARNFADIIVRWPRECVMLHRNYFRWKTSSRGEGGRVAVCAKSVLFFFNRHAHVGCTLKWENWWLTSESM